MTRKRKKRSELCPGLHFPEYVFCKVYTTVGYTFAKFERPDILHVRIVGKYFPWSETKLPPEEADLTPREAEMPPETNSTPGDSATLQDAKMAPWDAILPPASALDSCSDLLP